MRLSVATYLIVVNGITAAQSWSLVSTIPITDSTSDDAIVAMSLFADHVSIGDPAGQGHGVVHVHSRNEGGLGVWGESFTLQGDAAQGTEFGTAVVRGSGITY